MGTMLAEKIAKLHDPSEIDVIVPVGTLSDCQSLRTHRLPYITPGKELLKGRGYGRRHDT